VDDPVTSVSIAISASPVCEGSSVTLTASPSGGVPSAYGWFRDGAFVQTTTTPTLLLSNVTPAKAGSYTVKAANACGNATSPVPAELQVSQPLSTVTVTPSTPGICVGGTVTFTATISGGSGPFSYEWKRDGVSLGPPSSSSTLVIPNAQPPSSGSYTVTASNACNSADSLPVAFWVFGAPVNYCTAKPNSLNCASAMSWTGSPSMSSGIPFDITWGPSPGGSLNYGIFIYSLKGQAAVPLQGAYGTLCINLLGILRATPVLSGGSGGSCDGFYTIDWNAYATGPQAPAALQAGSTVDLQCWHRDIGNPGGANFSGALTFVMCP
jgi:hypothetical protein